MKKNKIALILSSFALALSVGTFIGVSHTNNEAKVAFATYTNGDGATYYNSIDDSKSGNALLTDLRSLNLSKRKSTVGYSSMGTSPSGQYKYTDYDPNYVKYDSNGQPYGTQISSFYTFTSATSWNREHVWPNSHGGGSKGDAGSPYPDADIHMPRPTVPAENSSRGNSFFVEGMNHSSNGWDPYTAGYSAESRGEAARITFYCTLVNSKLILAPNNTTPSGTDSVTGQSFGSGHTMGNLETLIKWNINYPVSDREKNRNEGAEYLQGNRNPFIDHPEYACKIWGNVNSKIKSMCDSASWDVGPSVSISRSSANIVVDDTTTISATASDSSTITWSSSDTTVVTVSSASASSGSNITLTGVGPGTATVTARATINSTTYSATCAVTVSSSGGGGGDTPVSGDGVTINVSDIPSAYSSTSFTASNYSFGCSNIGNSYSSGNMQWKSGQGYLYNTTPIANISSITIAAPSTGSFSGTIYVGSSSHPTSGTSYSITGGQTVNITGSPSYFTINAGTVSGGAKCGAITIGVSSSQQEKTLSSIVVATAPTKTTYTVGDYFDPTGLVITRTYSDSTSDTYTYSGHTSEFTFSPSTSTALTTSNTSVTITYGGKTCTQTISVTAASKTLSSISISGQKTSFTIDDSFSFGGTVTANFSDSTSSNVTASATFSGYDMSVAGNYTITVSYTYSGTTKTATYSITVAASGGGGGESSSFSGTYNYGNQGTGSGKTWSLTDCTDQSSYWLCPASGTESVANIPNIFENKTITSNVVITINSGTYGSGNNPSSSTFTIYTSSACTSQVTATQTGTLPTSKTYTDVIYTVSLANASSFSNDLAIKITKPGKQIRLVSITVEFDYTTSGSSSPTLLSISVATKPTKTNYTAGEYFSPTGLVINRNYSDSTSDTYTYVGHTSEFTFSPSTSTALTTDNVSVTITYGGKSCSQTISVTAAPATSITATCNKTFYVGETITKSDITVTTNTSEDVTSSVTFADYQFTYADASSGGALTNKQFQITYNDLNTTLTVQVQRKAYGTPTGTEPYSITYTDLPTSYQTSTSEIEAASGVKFIAYNLANYSSKMQFKASGGYFQTTQAMTLKSLTINNRESNALTVYGSTNGSSFSSAISGTNDVYDLTGYSYVKVMKNGNGAAYCASLTIEVASLETAENVANDIMYEDTVNQCVEKLDVVLLELNNLSESELNTFTTSSDYVISTARERLEAWARNQGKSIDYSSAGAVVLKSINNKLFTSIDKSIDNILIVIICSISVTSLFALYAIIKKKKGDR